MVIREEHAGDLFRRLVRRRPAPRRAKALIEGYEFPPGIERKVRRRHPQVDDATWPLVEQGLREWLICCAYRKGALLGMPSRVVDEAWHEFILHSAVYAEFCQQAYGEFLHHTPDSELGIPMPEALGETVLAWDRSGSGRRQESVLWDLDRRLGIEDPLGVEAVQLTGVRSTAAARGGGYGVIYGGDGGVGWGGADGGGSGDSGGSSCGGGCGGGGCGGGS